MKKEEQQGAQQPQALDVSDVFPEADCPLCYDVGRVAVSDPAEAEIETVPCPECQGALGDAWRVIQEMRARKVNHGREYSGTLHAWADRLEASLQAFSQKEREADTEEKARLFEYLPCRNRSAIHSLDDTVEEKQDAPRIGSRP